MANRWTRPTTPSMVCRSTDSGSHPQLGTDLHNRSRHPTWTNPTPKSIGTTPSKSGRRHGRHLHTDHYGTFSLQPYVYAHPTSTSEELQQPGTSSTTGVRSIQLVGLPYHGKPLAGSAHAANPRGTSRQQIAQRTANVRTQEEGSHWQHSQNGRVVVPSTVRGHRHRGTRGCDDGHSCQPHGQELRCTKPPESHDGSH